ncbi:hypothetical protein D3C71_1905880 [compost metagenome]
MFIMIMKDIMRNFSESSASLEPGPRFPRSFAVPIILAEAYAVSAITVALSMLPAAFPARLGG